MIEILIYCIFCYLYEFGYVSAVQKEEKEVPILSLVFAPVAMPIELGLSIYYILHKS